jgi:hypothetical protein
MYACNRFGAYVSETALINPNPTLTHWKYSGLYPALPLMLATPVPKASRKMPGVMNPHIRAMDIWV